MKKFEIERKFLIKNEQWREGKPGILYTQGYLKTSPYTIRVRVEGEVGFLTIKETIKDIIRYEFEYTIPIGDAKYMLKKLCKEKTIRKYRYARDYEGVLWTIDEFLDENQGLIIAEVELEKATQVFMIPPWAGQEVSSDLRYLNSNLIDCPFTKW